MKDDYLWDKTGHDPEIEAIEGLLAPLAVREPVAAPAPPPVRPAWGSLFAVLATAAALLLGVRWTMPPNLPRPESKPLTAAREIDLGRFGSVKAHEGALVEILGQSDDSIRLRLTRGTIEAAITLEARPRMFQVETPATTCVDLGCHYTLTVEPDGSTFVHVDFGQVAFVDGGRETWIPDGASCRAWPARGSGTPRWDDAPADLLAAVDALDRAAPELRSAPASAAIRACSRKRDALTLWHLAHDRDPQVADAAWSALIELVGAPEGVDQPRAPGAEERWKERLWWAWTMGWRGRR